MNLPHTTAQVFLVLLTLLSSSENVVDMSAHFFIKIVFLFCVLSGVFGQRTTELDYSIYSGFGNRSTIRQRSSKIRRDLDFNGDKNLTLIDAYGWFTYLDINNNSEVGQSEFWSRFNNNVRVWARSLYAFLDEMDGRINKKLSISAFTTFFSAADLNRNERISGRELRNTLDMLFRRIFTGPCPIATNAYPFNYSFHSSRL